MANFLPPSKLEVLIRLLGLGHPQRHIAHALDISEVTVNRYAVLLGEMAIDYLDSQHHDLAFERYEFDEFYHHIYCREQNLKYVETAPEKAGTILHFVSVVPKTGFIATYRVAESNGEEDTREFILDLKRRLKKNPEGGYLPKPTFVFDGHGSYVNAVKELCGDDVNAWRLTKRQTNKTADGKPTRRRFDGVIRDVIVGEPTDELFFTNNVESANRTARHHNSRVARRNLAFSKRFRAHVRQFAYWIFYHNYCLIPSRSYYTPAEKAERISGVIGAEEIVRMLDAYQRRGEEEGVLGQIMADQDDASDDAPFWVYHNYDRRAARVHHATCNNCRGGRGRGGEPGKSGVWYAAADIDKAVEIAKKLVPNDYKGCTMCLDIDGRNWRQKTSIKMV